MASDNGSPKRDASPDDDENPFIAFRRYADEQMASLLQGVIGLPSALHPSTVRWLHQDEEMRQRVTDSWGTTKPLDKWDKQKGSQGQNEDGTSEEPVKALDIGTKSEKPTEDATMRCPYRPLDQESQHPSSPLPKPSFMLSRLFLPGNEFRLGDSMIKSHKDQYKFAKWPIAYLTLSSYSPLYLEHQEGFREQGSKWRRAFEDLIAVHNGREMLQDEQRYKQHNSADWIGSMIERGIFGPWNQIGSAPKDQIKYPLLTKRLALRHPENDAAEDDVTELDLYERFLGSQGRLPDAPDSFTRPSLVKPVAKLGNDEDKSSIVFTLTTTERKTMPDGTVHTKVVFKKRFADGREESSETLHTAQSRPTQNCAPLVAASSQISKQDKEERLEKQDQEKSNKGWFWS